MLYGHALMLTLPTLQPSGKHALHVAPFKELQTILPTVIGQVSIEPSYLPMDSFSIIYVHSFLKMMIKIAIRLGIILRIAKHSQC